MPHAVYGPHVSLGELESSLYHKHVNLLGHPSPPPGPSCMGGNHLADEFAHIHDCTDFLLQDSAHNCFHCTLDTIV